MATSLNEFTKQLTEQAQSLVGRKFSSILERDNIYIDLQKMNEVLLNGADSLVAQGNGNITLITRYASNIPLWRLNLEMKYDGRVSHKKMGVVTSVNYELMAIEYPDRSFHENVMKAIYNAEKATLHKRIDNCDSHIRYLESQIEEQRQEQAQQQSWLDEVEKENEKREKSFSEIVS